MDYAIVRIGNKQHRVRDGETLVVDRLHTDEGKTFEPDVLLGADDVKVTATVVAHERGPKIRIGKYRRRTGYKRHNGFRAATTRIEISLGGKRAAKPKAEKAAPEKAAPKATTEKAATKKVPAAKAWAPEPAAKAGAAATGLPEGYAEMTVAVISGEAKTWERPALEAALAYEHENAARKGAIAALESALAASEEEES